MRLEKILQRFVDGRDVYVLLQTRGQGSATGKFIVGPRTANPEELAIVFDDSAEFHKEIGQKHQVQPQGGGWLRFDPLMRRIHIEGRSTLYGRENNRMLTLTAFRQAFPDYVCTADF